MAGPRGCHCMSLTESTCPRSTCLHLLMCTSHSLHAVSACPHRQHCSDPESHPCCRPDARFGSVRTAGPCHPCGCSHLTLWSKLQLASQSPAWWYLTAHTACLWSDSVATHFCFSKLHSFTVLSPAKGVQTANVNSCKVSREVAALSPKQARQLLPSNSVCAATVPPHLSQMPGWCLMGGSQRQQPSPCKHTQTVVLTGCSGISSSLLKQQARPVAGRCMACMCHRGAVSICNGMPAA